MGFITKTLDDEMAEHPSVELCAHESYDPRARELADDNLMRVVLTPPAFPFLEDMRSLSRLKTFEEILGSKVDEDEDYRQLIEQGVWSSLQPESLGLTLSEQLVGVLVDLTTGFEEGSRQTYREVELIEDEELLDADTKPIPDVRVGSPSGEQMEETGVVRETLLEVLTEAELSFPQTNAVNTRP